MKGQPLFRRVVFALNGLREAIVREPSIRWQLLATVALIAVLAATHASPVWWALCALAAGMVIVAELINSALEALADVVHPALHPGVRLAKDMAAAAVLVAACVAATVALLYLLR